MKPRDRTHEMIHGKPPGCQYQVFPGSVGLPEGLGVESQIEVRVAAGVTAGRLRHGVSGGDHGVCWARAAVEGQHLPHRHPAVVTHGQDRLPGRLSPGLAGHAREVPGRILHIRRVDRAMKFELSATVGEPVGVVECQAPLPEMRLHLGTGLDEGVEPTSGCLRLAVEEQPYRVVEALLR